MASRPQADPTQLAGARYILLNISNIGGRSVRFDAQCDVAAVVYGPNDGPDRLLIEFADDLFRSGFRPVGVVQSGRSLPNREPEGACFRDLRGWTVSRGRP